MNSYSVQREIAVKSIKSKNKKKRENRKECFDFLDKITYLNKLVKWQTQKTNSQNNLKYYDTFSFAEWIAISKGFRNIHTDPREEKEECKMLWGTVYN